MSDEWAEDLPPNFGARNVTLCEQVEYDLENPDTPFTLRGVRSVFWVSTGFPAVWRETVWVYVEFFGNPGTYEFWVEVGLVEPTGTNPTKPDAMDLSFGPYRVRLMPGEFVNGKAYRLRSLKFPAPGLYELTVRAAGFPSPLTTHRIFVEDE